MDGIHHVIVGSAGAPLYTPTYASYAAFCAKTSCYAIFDETPTTLKFVGYDDSGNVLETINLTKQFTISGSVKSAGGTGIYNAVVTAGGACSNVTPVVTDSSGNYSLNLPGPGTYETYADALGRFVSVTGQISSIASDVSSFNITDAGNTIKVNSVGFPLLASFATVGTSLKVNGVVSKEGADRVILMMNYTRQTTPFPDNDITFFWISDTHYGASGTDRLFHKQRIQAMNALPGTAYPATNVGSSGRPVVILQHEGFDSFSFAFSSRGEAKRLYDVIKNHNVIAIIWGHTGGYAQYKWGGIDVFGTDGTMEGFHVFHITPTQLICVCREWSNGTWMTNWTFTKTITGMQ